MVFKRIVMHPYRWVLCFAIIDYDTPQQALSGSISLLPMACILPA